MSELRLQEPALPPELHRLWNGLAGVMAACGATSNVVPESLAALHADLENALQQHGALVLRRAGPFLLVNGNRAEARPQERAGRRRLLGALAAWNVESLQVEPGLGLDELLALVHLLARRDGGAAWPGAAARLRDSGVRHVQVQSADAAPAEARSGLRLHRVLAQRVYLDAVRQCALLQASAEPAAPVRLRDLRRLVHRVIDLVEEDNTVLVGLTTVKSVSFAPNGTGERGGKIEASTDEGIPAANDIGAPVSTHSTNVAILSILLGRAARLPRGSLAGLGLAALLHDIGTTPAESAGAGDAFAAAFEMRMHAVRGAARLLGMGAIDAVAHAALVALEHHRPAREPGTGDSSQAPGLAGRIVQIADLYDLLTRGGVHGRAPVSPDRALAALARQAGERFDAQLLGLLVSTLGVYPPGTVVELDSGEMGVVVRCNRDPRLLERPLVRLLLDRDGRPFPGEPMQDLAEAHPGTRRLARRVERTLDPERLHIDPAALFLD